MKIFLVVLIILLAADFIIENKIVLSSRCKDFGGELKIMHISDIHKDRKGKDNCRISEKAEKEKPDLIFITGDFVSRSETDFKSAKILLERLSKTAPVYMVYGNHEQSLYNDRLLDFSEMIEKTDANLLVNEGRYIELKGRKLHIYGVQQKYSTYKKNGSYRNLDKFTIKDMKSALGEKADSEVLLLAHNPLWAEVYAEWGADYTFSGHVHGGAVRIFGIGILSPERRFFPKYSKGIYKIGSMNLCVSAGIGKKRLFNPPEIVFYKI